MSTLEIQKCNSWKDNSQIALTLEIDVALIVPMYIK